MAKHGTHLACIKHTRLGEELCAACLEFWQSVRIEAEALDKAAASQGLGQGTPSSRREISSC